MTFASKSMIFSLASCSNQKPMGPRPSSQSHPKPFSHGLLLCAGLNLPGRKKRTLLSLIATFWAASCTLAFQAWFIIPFIPLFPAPTPKSPAIVLEEILGLGGEVARRVGRVSMCPETCFKGKQTWRKFWELATKERLEKKTYEFRQEETRTLIEISLRLSTSVVRCTVEIAVDLSNAAFSSSY